MIPKPNQKFNAYMIKYKSRFAASSGPFICAKVDNNGVHTADRLFPLRSFTFKVVEPPQEARTQGD